MDTKDRAVTPEQKRAVIERLYAAWLAKPNLRLGQLIANASFRCDASFDPFFVEDFPLVKAAEAWIKGE